MFRLQGFEAVQETRLIAARDSDVAQIHVDQRLYTWDPLGMMTGAVVEGRTFRYLYDPDNERIAAVERVRSAPRRATARRSPSVAPAKSF